MSEQKKGLSGKELSFISKLELKEKYFFTREDIKSHFTSDNEMNVYLHRLKKKGRIIKLNKTKYSLIPIKAVGGHWSEHPFILIDEIMNSKDYVIAEKSAAYYWKLLDQIPFEYVVYTPKKYGEKELFNVRIRFVRRRTKNLPKSVKRKINQHPFIVATKEESKQWM